MLSVKQAESIVLDLVQPLNCQVDVEIVNLLAAGDRILAAPVTSNLDFPHWDNSAMDGYAVLHADISDCSAEQPAVLEIVEEIPAGKQPQKSLQSGQAARIFTGSVMPEGADTVMMQEVTRREGDRVFILAASEPQAFVRHRASFYQAGQPLLPSGIPLNAPEIAVLAAAQCSQLSVYRRPRVAILSTGNELVTVDRTLQPGQLVDSNQYALATAVNQIGAEAIPMGIVPDDPEALRSAIAQAITTADIVLSTGGVSVGDYDYVEEILAQLGAEIHIRAVAVKPGKPLTVATFSQKEGENLVQTRFIASGTGEAKAKALRKNSVLYFGLPGNPVSALVTFWRFVRPAIKKLSGISQGWEPMFVYARSLHDLRSDGKRESYLWGKLHLVDGAYEFHLAGGSHSSGNLINLAQTNSLAVLPVGQTVISAGEQVQVLAVSL